MGYLHQPHTSAGRVPTDKGYRLFVNALLQNSPQIAADLDLETTLNVEKEFEDLFQLANSLAHSLAQASSLLVLSYLRRRDLIFKEGWEELLQNPEFSQPQLIADFIDYLNYLEDNVKNYCNISQMAILIGKENHFPKAQNFATITFACPLTEEEPIVLSIVGPKRMSYEKILLSLTKY